MLKQTNHHLSLDIRVQVNSNLGLEIQSDTDLQALISLLGITSLRNSRRCLLVGLRVLSNCLGVVALVGIVVLVAVLATAAAALAGSRDRRVVY